MDIDTYYQPFYANNDGWVGKYIGQQARMARVVFQEKTLDFWEYCKFFHYRNGMNGSNNGVIRDYMGDLSNSVHAAKVTARQNLDPTVDAVWSNVTPQELHRDHPQVTWESKDV